MTFDTMKLNLRKYYDHDAKRRNKGSKQEWKFTERRKFSELALKEGKINLLEIGAGTGQDSMFFMEQGFDVTAIDLSSEMVKIYNLNSVHFYSIHYPPHPDYDISSTSR